MDWMMVVLVVAAVAALVTWLKIAIAAVEQRVAGRLGAVERRLRYLEDNVTWAGERSGDKKGLSVGGSTADAEQNKLRAGWRDGRCKRGL